MRSIQHSHILKRVGLPLLLTVVFCLGFAATAVVPAYADNLSFRAVRDCDADAVINCGSLSTAELSNAYSDNAYVQKVYAYFGIRGSDIKNLPAAAVAGHVDKHGNVYLAGRPAAIATNVLTAGRQDIAGSKRISSQGVVFYTRPLALTMTANSADAFVVTHKGNFSYAILASNGDPVVSTIATPPAKKPARPTPVLPAGPITPPSQLVNTGPMDISTIALVAIATGAGTLAAYRYQLIKLRRNN